MNPNIPAVLKITRDEYVELRNTFDVIFMDLKISEPAIYLDKIYEIINKSSFLDEFKDRCKEYFPKYPKRMSAWYAHAVINPLEKEKERAKETFSVITQFADSKITAQLSSHTFKNISNEELKSCLEILDKTDGMSTISFKYAKAFYQYAINFESSSLLFESIKDYSKDKQFYMMQTLIDKGWFTPKKYKELIFTNDSLLTKEDFYNIVLEKENDIEKLNSLTTVFLHMLSREKFTDKAFKAAFSASTEKNKYFIENLLINEEDANKAIDYAMKYETKKDVNSTINFINYLLTDNFNGINSLEPTHVCLMITRCFVARVINPQFCDVIVNILQLLKEEDNQLYKEVHKKIHAYEDIPIYAYDGTQQHLKVGSPEFKAFLSELFFNSLSSNLGDKPIKIQTKI